MRKTQEMSNSAVIYCRVSTEEQTQGGSLDHQEKECRRFADRQGLDVIKVFREEGESGTKGNRTQLNELIKLISIRKNNIGYVIALKVDRLMRNNEELIGLNLFLKKLRVRVLYVMENNEDSSVGKLARGFSSVIAEYESNVNSERTKAGNKEAFLSGRYIKQLKGYSFKATALGKKVITPNADAKYIIKGFELMAKGVYSQREVLTKLKQEGFNSYPQAFNKILHNPVYCGILPDTQNVNNGQSVKGIHEPLIGEKVFNKVQDIMDGKRPAATPRKRNNPEFPLRKFIRCKKCGQFMTSSFSKGKLKKYPYYHCGKCASSPETRILRSKVEPEFLAYLKGLGMGEDTVIRFEKTIITAFKAKTRNLEEQRRAVEKAITTLERERSNLIDLLAKGKTKAEYITPEIERRTREIDDKKQRLADTTDTPNITECWEFAKYFINNIADIWEKADLNLRQKLQCLISPEGFYFEDNLIKHQKIPHFISIFSSNTGDFKTQGG